MSRTLAAPDPAQAREAARAVLAGRRFHPRELPKPFRSPLRWLGDRIADASGWLWDHTFSPLASWFRALPAVLQIALVGATLVVLVVLVVRAARSRHRAVARREERLERRTAEAARELERRADAAEDAGDYETALRLRFRAGLMRLDRDVHAIELRASTTSVEVQEELHNRRFDQLARTHEEVVYAGRQAQRDDAREAAHDWPKLVEEARKK